MRCEQIRELLSPYIDQMTDEKENKLINAHLANCEECRRKLDYLKFICGTLGSLEHPQVPARFKEDFHKRLLEEKTSLFVAKEVKRPKRSGWIAAGVAGLAIAVGVYASSILPLGDLVASFQDKNEEKQDKPKIAIEDIIRSFKGWNTEGDTPDIDIADNTIIDEENTPAVPNEEVVETTPETEEPDQGNDVKPPIVPKYTNEYLTKVKVTDVGQAINEVIQIAEANGAEYAISPNTTTMQALSASNVKEVTLIIDKKKSSEFLEKLDAIGSVGAPVRNQIELTQQYADFQDQIITTEGLIKALESKEELSELE
ncbi:MAG: hypothetical protein GX790_03325, partial [Syntrophomonadaceae bacterium]|nr:hypothetical protein [Syntrophomonadaceae bacterium]